MAPSLGTVTEEWLRRMLRMLDPHVVAVATFDELGLEHLPQGAEHLLLPRFQRFRKPIGRVRALLPWMYQHKKLKQLIERQQITHVFVHYLNFGACFTPVWRDIDAKVFVHSHGVDATPEMLTAETPRKPVWPRNYARWIVEMSQHSHIIANSHYGKSCLLRMGIPSHNISVKHLGVPIPPAPPQRDTRKESLELLQVGRLIDCKGPDYTIKAFAKAREQNLRGTLHFVGDGPMRAECEELTRKLQVTDHVKFHGSIPYDKVLELYQRADVYTQHNIQGRYTGQSEMFGATVIEAMGMALPCVVGASGGPTETVEDGVTGMLITPGDVQEHAQALLDLRDPELRIKMGEEGYKRAAAHFSLESEKQNLLTILTKTL